MYPVKTLEPRSFGDVLVILFRLQLFGCAIMCGWKDRLTSLGSSSTSKVRVIDETSNFPCLLHPLSQQKDMVAIDSKSEGWGKACRSEVLTL